MKWFVGLCFFCLWLTMTSVTAQETNAPAKPELLHAADIENFYRLSDHLYSGSAPEGEGFAELKKMGIRTIISVDGSKPDVAGAKKVGLRYVHLPIGYDSVPTNQALRLVQATSTLPGPIFIHCHHGLHRGPAAAAVICEGVERWTPEQALAWMKQAGTATNYAGLYKSVAEFRTPTPLQLKGLPTTFPETVEVSPMVDVMVGIDERFDHLKLIKKAGFVSPEGHSELVPAQEALLLLELFKEMGRSPEAQKRDQEFLAKLGKAQEAAAKLEAALKITPVVKETAEAALQQVNDSCTACHKAYRNVARK